MRFPRALSNRALGVLRREFGGKPTKADVRERAIKSGLRPVNWLLRLRGVGRNTAFELAEWAGLDVPELRRCPTCGRIRW